MRILLTNDDGIHAPGLEVLESIARDLSDDVWVVAPETDQSGASHSLTLSDPLRSREIGPKRFAVSGTPTDCVIMGLRHLLDTPPDLVLSGVNRGQNIADDTTYSGTIAGAMEGVALGVKSFALSQAYGWDAASQVNWDCARTHGARVIRKLLAVETPGDTLFNINFPDCAPDDIKGLQVTRQGKRDQNLLMVDAREDGRGRPYYWLAFRRHLSNPAEGTDLYAIYNNYIAVTPVKLDLTDHDMLASVAGALAE
ncbi:5'/3'-nucleotidase SurE [Coralliovum pocilloporae]|uniref:5'/3'-nucleotidase SurE n=1 Tax=Coralliovum pocilloporae TaxID=3066369 RepID=UPI003306B31B